MQCCHRLNTELLREPACKRSKHPTAALFHLHYRPHRTRRRITPPALATLCPNPQRHGATCYTGTTGRRTGAPPGRQ